MKIIDFETFAALPDGIIFSYWDPNLEQPIEGLYRRGVVIPDDYGTKDYYQIRAIAQYWNTAQPIVELTPQRWGEYNYNQLYLLYDSDDLALVIKALGIHWYPFVDL